MKNALEELIALEKDTRDFDFEWPDATSVLDQARSECAEIQEAIDTNEPAERIQEEIGDLIHTGISLCVFAGFDVEQTINVIVKKFASRMQSVKSISAERGHTNLKGQTTAYMLDIWNQAKLQEKQK